MGKKRYPLWFEDSFEALGRIHEDIHRFMKSFWDQETRFMPVDIEDAGDSLVVKADLPGFSKKDVKVRVFDNSVEILARKEREEETKEKNFYRRERSYGEVARVIPLPEEVEAEGAKARFENGVLEIVIPKKEKSGGREIEIE
ncbi:MAG: Hsp20/alpha crystallin family protein [Candidatus Micrarchaeota archaeon]|nr:Hsp20/alpha crystallin family protein [Candidatus Micrarchaeota archaeon]